MLLAVALSAGAQQATTPESGTTSAPAAAATAPRLAPTLQVEGDPVASPDPENTTAIKRSGDGFVLQTEVDEVVLNATVLDGHHQVPDLKKEDFEVFEDGVRQTIRSFQHNDIPVSIALVIDNSGSMSAKRPAVNKAALDLIAASNPEDEAFVVNFSDEAYLDQDFTHDVAKLREGLSHIEAKGGTALRDAVIASADKLAAEARHSKQVILLITDGEDNASTQDRTQTIERVQRLSGPVIYTIGLLFGDEMSRSEVKNAREDLKILSDETGGMAFFPKSVEQIDQIAAEVARDIRNQYTIGYHSSHPATDTAFRHIELQAHGKGTGKLTVRTRTGYFPAPPTVHSAQPTAR